MYTYTQKTLRGPIPNGGICRIYPLSVPQVRFIHDNFEEHSGIILTPLIVLEYSFFGRVFPGNAQINRADSTNQDTVKPAPCVHLSIQVRRRAVWFEYCTGTLPIVLEHSCTLTRQSISASGHVHARADPPAPRVYSIQVRQCAVWQVRRSAV